MTFLGDLIGEGQSKLTVFRNACGSVTLSMKRMKLHCGLPTNSVYNLEQCSRPGKYTSEVDSASILPSIERVRSSGDNLSSALQSDPVRIRLMNVRRDNV